MKPVYSGNMIYHLRLSAVPAGLQHQSSEDNNPLDMRYVTTHRGVYSFKHLGNAELARPQMHKV